MKNRRTPRHPPDKPKGSAMLWVIVTLAIALLLLIVCLSTDRSSDTPRTLIPLPVIVLPFVSGPGPILH